MKKIFFTFLYFILILEMKSTALGITLIQLESVEDSTPPPTKIRSITVSNEDDPQSIQESQEEGQTWFFINDNKEYPPRILQILKEENSKGIEIFQIHFFDLDDSKNVELAQLTIKSAGTFARDEGLSIFGFFVGKLVDNEFKKEAEKHIKLAPAMCLLNKQWEPL